ncbi:bifunctional UDP-N-acetylglucosamine diphosphorylase/glucosamine-1-phosphate N-acetyltransferase GlmU [Shouchella shacheensis]|uniref:bifunctional UDP-N-acetylglucosamine diphosphorylase/glucosamine-1-phosphate N-acetyltransferase GlmU n=1 Tax=Shouchella shacheensis TaxID=1649580 RepID=UPI0007400C96|nr:bifunctional UDP-N-acetylglucosamine diphosphorylase/glucosamine-1-phosphate N-acetyltransferase GlmU [Shouchella shacheensis]
MSGRFAVILAAGQGTRMKSKLYKVLHQVCGKPMVQHVVDQVQNVGFDETTVVVGHGAEQVKDTLRGEVTFSVQDEQLGTGHAVRCAEDALTGKKGVTVVLCGDTPLLTAKSIEKLIKTHEAAGAKASVLTAVAPDPTGYGRVMRNEAGHVQKIVEHKDASEEERLVSEINTGTYCFDNEQLFAALAEVTNDNVQGEYYLPDVIEILQQQGQTIAAYQTESFDETLGINDRVALSSAEAVMQARINEYWMREGVTLIDRKTTYISAEARIGRDVVVHPNVTIKGPSLIGEDCEIGAGSEIVNSTLGSLVHVRQSLVVDSEVGSGVAIGPFAHLRPNTKLEDDVRVGNFVELKKSTIGKASKVSHLSYIGDADIGSDVNVGCGVVTVNYDGRNKFKTTVEKEAFIGSGSNLIAPVQIGERAFVAAGSTITDDVPGEALSIARARQVNKENYVKKED